MNKLILFPLICLIAYSTSFGQVLSEVTQEEYKNYQKAEIEINAVFQKVLVEYGSNTEFTKNLKAAQKLWLQFRDAELKARYPENGQYGSVGSMCKYMFLTRLTEERINTLKVWLDGIPEGDVCTGSVKMKTAGISPERESPGVRNFGVKVLNIPAQSVEGDFNENAKIAMDVVTDASGKVVSATYQPRGSTTSNPQMVSIARRRAFELKNIGSGSGPQKGTIIFNFKVRS